MIEESEIEFSRDDFMDFFRDDNKLNTLTLYDRQEIFAYILPGRSDFTKEFLDEILSDYDVYNIKVIEVNGKE